MLASKALQLMQDWRMKDKIGDWGGVGTFTSGKAAMMFEGSLEPDRHPEDKEP